MCLENSPVLFKDRKGQESTLAEVITRREQDIESYCQWQVLLANNVFPINQCKVDKMNILYIDLYKLNKGLTEQLKK